MKKWVILTLITLTFSVVLFAGNTLSGETTTVPITTIPETTVTESTSPYQYVYVNQDDLVNQIYEDLYAEIYAELYAELAASIANDLYEEIYQSVMNQFETAFTLGSIEVPADEVQLQIYDVVELSDQSVVGVSSYVGTDGLALGSAVIFDYNATTQTYYVITNEHVVDGGDNYKVVFSDMEKVTATLLGVDADIDIAILSFSAIGLNRTLQVSPLGDSDLLTPGTLVLAAGHPKGYDFYGSVNLGIVAGVNRLISGETVAYIQHDAAINSGNSGGPLYNLAGEVIGINVSKYATTDIEGMGFAIPINTVKEVITQILG